MATQLITDSETSTKFPHHGAVKVDNEKIPESKAHLLSTFITGAVKSFIISTLVVHGVKFLLKKNPFFRNFLRL